VIVRNADDHAVEEPALSEAEGIPTYPTLPNRVKAFSLECGEFPCAAPLPRCHPERSEGPMQFAGRHPTAAPSTNRVGRTLLSVAFDLLRDSVVNGSPIQPARTKLPESTVEGYGLSRAAQLVGDKETSPSVRGVPLSSWRKEKP
jgi:hypothetical protein